VRMAGMDAGPATAPGGIGFYMSSWVVMMTAMMLPAVAPAAVALGARPRELGDRRGGRDAVRTPLFLAGYLAVWAAAGLAGYAVLEIGRSLAGGLFAWDRAGRWAAAGILAGAALYQLTPAKDACLSRCRSRRAQLRPGWTGSGSGTALSGGVRYGAWCLGCCWALMAALFALGEMSIGWMVLLSALIAGERLLPTRARGKAGVALVVSALAIGVAVAPARVPMLTVPRGHMSMPATSSSSSQSMGMPAAGSSRH